jgi:hypothetical protein
MNLRFGSSGHGPDSRATLAEHEPPTEAFTFTHEVVASSCGKMARVLDPDPANLAWQKQDAAFLVAGPCDATPDPAGDLIWDFSWPVR